MKHVLHRGLALLFSSLLIGFSPSLADDKPHLVRQRFVPGKSENGASWSALRPEPDNRGGVFLQAWAGIGEKFPVKEKGGPTLFEVTVLDGDDDHLLMEVRSKEVTQKIDVRRDKSEQVVIAGIRYELAYPSTSVSSADKATTNQAMIMVCRRPES
jgi:hypothetical protein